MTSGVPKFEKLTSIDSCTATIVLLHGLGDTPQGILRLARLLRSRPGLNHVQFIVPAAPLRRLTATGHTTTAWFDIRSFAFNTDGTTAIQEDEEGMRQSVDSLDALLSGLRDSGIDPSRTVLGGFSQGGAMTLLTGLTTATKLAGLFVLSGRLPMRQQIKSMVSPHASSLPVFYGHGTADSVVPHALGRNAADFMISELEFTAAPISSLSTRILDWLSPNSGTPIQAKPTPTGLAFHSYVGLAHELGSEELDDLASWLNILIPAVSESQ
ncbi:Phospholipase/Carboxylesterase-domain-containing protein [Favolaschia claudopus]|uniref:Acyl-protein thioesterase 1 n=1 Tax=Favolaschia claudopus TaxID=2862362 RepID=A0AAW0EK35_9AGAR